MNKPHVPILLVACLYIITGALGLLSHLIQFNSQPQFDQAIVWISLVSLAAIVSGVYMLRRHNWARWLAIAWIAFHVVLSVFHSRLQLLVHSLLFALFAYVLFRPSATRYFRAPGTP
jgi:hypothetical protein